MMTTLRATINVLGKFIFMDHLAAIYTLEPSTKAISFGCFNFYFWLFSRKDTHDPPSVKLVSVGFILLNFNKKKKIQK